MQTPEILKLIAEFFDTYSIQRVTPQTRNDLLARCRNLIAEEVEEVRQAADEYRPDVLSTHAALLGELADVRYVTAYARHALELEPAQLVLSYDADMAEANDLVLDIFAYLEGTAAGGEDEARMRRKLAAALDLLDRAVNRAAFVHSFPLDAAIRTVHAANLAKVWPDGKIHKREDGKILKPPTWTPPDLLSLLAA
ncbi:hypothetical protein [Nonomuraea sp. SYSU D8015]|uniref:hypothetical protein n=1 Tax=Nonomuraea sp. SYSU D8015 TaxID=2593644 RepID=UPI0016600F8F|nr:hypothetical protein [Nonomuraea sp. SYSU D8015]